MKADSWKAPTKPDRGHGHKVLDAVYQKSEHEYVVSSSSLHSKHHHQSFPAQSNTFWEKRELKEKITIVIIHI